MRRAACVCASAGPSLSLPLSLSLRARARVCGKSSSSSSLLMSRHTFRTGTVRIVPDAASTVDTTFGGGGGAAALGGRRPSSKSEPDVPLSGPTALFSFPPLPLPPVATEGGEGRVSNRGRERRCSDDGTTTGCKPRTIAYPRARDRIHGQAQTQTYTLTNTHAYHKTHTNTLAHTHSLPVSPTWPLGHFGAPPLQPFPRLFRFVLQGGGHFCFKRLQLCCQRRGSCPLLCCHLLLR